MVEDLIEKYRMFKHYMDNYLMDDIEFLNTNRSTIEGSNIGRFKI